MFWLNGMRMRLWVGLLMFWLNGMRAWARTVLTTGTLARALLLMTWLLVGRGTSLMLWLHSLWAAGRVGGLRTSLLFWLNRTWTLLLLRTSSFVVRLLVVLAVALLVLRLRVVVWLSVVVWVGALGMGLVICFHSMGRRVVVWIGALRTSLVVWLFSVWAVRVVVILRMSVIIVIVVVVTWTAVMVTWTAVVTWTTVVTTRTTSGTMLIIVIVIITDWLDFTVLAAVVPATHNFIMIAVRTHVLIIGHLSLRTVAGWALLIIRHRSLIPVRIVAAV